MVVSGWEIRWMWQKSHIPSQWASVDSSQQHVAEHYHKVKLDPHQLTSANHILLNWTCISIFLTFKICILKKKLLKPVLYCPITSGSFTPCSVDIGSCLGDIITKIEPIQKKKKVNVSFLFSYLKLNCERSDRKLTKRTLIIRNTGLLPKWVECLPVVQETWVQS